MYLYDLYKSWLQQKSEKNDFRLCLAWDLPEENDSINDISIYEVLDCLAECSKYTNTVSKSQFFDLYMVTKTIIMHTDGRETRNSPIEWFEKVCEISKDIAMTFLATYGISKITPLGYFEEFFAYFLENSNSFLESDEWFLLCLTEPLLCSEKLLSVGLENLGKISDNLQCIYKRWVKCIPFIQNNQGSEITDFSDDIRQRYFKEFNIEIPKKEKKEDGYLHYASTDADNKKERFSAKSLEDALNYFKTEYLYDEDIDAFIRLLFSLDTQSQKKLILGFLKSCSFSQKCKIDKLLEKIENKTLYIFLEIGYFIYKSDGYLKTMKDFAYLEDSYRIDRQEALKIFREILGIRILHSEYPLWQSCNLILALISLDYDKNEVSELFNLLFSITQKKLPVSNDYVFDMNLYNEIEKYSKIEIFILLLITRFNRLGVEKNQFAIFALSYVARNYSDEFLNVMSFIYQHEEFLLPMHRALLLQIVKEEISSNCLTESFKIGLMKNFPTGYYYENFLITELCDLKLEVPEIRDAIVLQNSENDESFFSSINIRYDFLRRRGFSFDGLFKLFEVRRNNLSKQYGDDFYLHSEDVIVPNVAISNTIYEVINHSGSNQLMFFYNFYGNIFHPFLLRNILLSCGSIDKRPSFLPLYSDIENIKEIENSTDIMQYSNEDWVILAYSEEQIIGDAFKQKNTIKCNYFVYSSDCKSITCNYIFNINQYFDKAPLTKMNIVSEISVYDYLESHTILFLSPFVIDKLNLHLNINKFSGLCAVDSQNNGIAKIATWATDYLGNLGDGIEIPKQKGTALLFRKDKLDLLQQLYSKHLCTITTKRVSSQFKDSHK